MAMTLSAVGLEGAAKRCLQTSSRAELQNSSGGKREVVIVGAGPAGCLMAFFCVRRGFHVHLIEKRTLSTDQYVGSDSRSYTMLLTNRAVQALEAADVQVPASLMGPLLGGCVHLPNGNMRVFNYSSSNSSSELKSFGVSRQSFVKYLQQTLLNRYPDDVSAHFGWELTGIDDKKSVASFQPHIDQDNNELQLRFDLLVGADGVSSKTRTEILKLDSEQSQPKDSPLSMKFTPNPEKYKSFYVEPKLAKTSPLFSHHNYVQSWPSLNMLLVGMADGSFWGGSKNAELLSASTPSEVDEIFRRKAPEVYDLLLQQNSNFPQDFLQQPAISFGGAVILSHFHHRNMVLVGDAAHAMFPSYGTGCNVALEDCFLLDQILEELQNTDDHIDCFKAAEEFTRRRLEDAHAIVEMNSDLRLLPLGLVGIIQTTIHTTLRKAFPALIPPTSYQLLWSHVPFTVIKKQKQVENAIFYSLVAVPIAALAAGVVKTVLL